MVVAARGRVAAFLAAPVCLLPVWLLAAVVAVATVVATGVAQLTGAALIAGVSAAVVGVGGVAVTRRRLARRGDREVFSELPHASDASSAVTAGAVRGLAVLGAVLAGVPAALLARLLGADELVSGGMEMDEAIAIGAAVPAYLEVDTRLGVRVARRQLRE